jgi:hypothetical protein
MGGEVIVESIVTIRVITACFSHAIAWCHKQKAHPSDGKYVTAKRMTKAKGNSATKVFPVLEAKKKKKGSPYEGQLKSASHLPHLSKFPP